MPKCVVCGKEIPEGKQVCYICETLSLLPQTEILRARRQKQYDRLIEKDIRRCAKVYGNSDNVSQQD